MILYRAITPLKMEDEIPNEKKRERRLNLCCTSLEASVNICSKSVCQAHKVECQKFILFVNGGADTWKHLLIQLFY